ncbi:MAG: hypothetical protein IH624_06980 [Phycisphaerae bacterium]|nr:hypothetical protein [Phycisphaerae bacterium]
MKKEGLILCLHIALAAFAQAAVRVDVYEADEVTPFDGRPLMVGSELSLVVSSDTGDYWGGGLFIEGPDRTSACLSARGFNPNTCDWQGSHYAGAGDDARVISWKDPIMWGFDLYTSDTTGMPGKWFVIDYRATGSGDPNVRVYDHAASFSIPSDIIQFSHVPSRDFNGDGVVNIADYVLLASHWLVEDCNEPNGCGRVDINADGYVDVQDLALFADYWMWGVPRVPIVAVEPEVTFRIADAMGSNDISLSAGESVILYVMMERGDVPIHTFHIEVDINNPTIGSIDNTPYDPDNPPGPGTARILAKPRDAFFDDWGPGQLQPEGIALGGVSISSPMADGPLASFVYTSLGTGDVTLHLSDLLAAYDVRLEPIVIHQVTLGMQATFGEMSSPEESTQPSSAARDVDAIVGFLEEIWITEGDMQALVSEAEWHTFINSVKQSDSLIQ